jgi:hypothetical protein
MQNPISVITKPKMVEAQLKLIEGLSSKSKAPSSNPSTLGEKKKKKKKKKQKESRKEKGEREKEREGRG